MSKTRHRIHATALVTLTAVALTAATASVAYARIIIPGTQLPNGTIATGGGGPSGPVTVPDDPASKPRPPGQPALVSRTATSLKIQWQDNSSYEQGFRLYRGPAYSGPWTQIAALGLAPGNTTVMQYNDTGVSRDTRYYYRVGAYNAFGEAFSLPQTFGTIDGRVPVSRLQFRVRTANVADAGTDDDIHVAVNDYNVNHGTYLDYGRDDFERGDVFTYELLPDGVADLSDINQLMIFKTGSDGWCIDSLALLVNGGEIYNQSFAPCLWLDNSGNSQNAFVVGRDTLRAHPLWQQFIPPFKSSLPKRELGDLVEGIVGNIIHDDIVLDLPVYIGNANPYWGELHGDRAVVVTGKDASAVHIGFNLRIGVIGEDLNVDISFDIRLTGICRTPTTPPALHPTIENIDAKPHFGTYTQILTAALINLANDPIASAIEANLKAVLPHLERDFAINIDQIACVTPTVDAEGNVDFVVATVPRISRTTVIGTLTGGVKLP